MSSDKVQVITRSKMQTSSQSSSSGASEATPEPQNNTIVNYESTEPQGTQGTCSLQGTATKVEGMFVNCGSNKLNLKVGCILKYLDNVLSWKIKYDGPLVC